MMPVPVIERALELLPGVDFVNAYGLTETSSTIAVLAPDDHRDAITSDDPAVRRPRLGRPPVGGPRADDPLPVRRGLPAGESGEIWVRGEQVSGEYLGRVRGRDWFPTGDGGFFDAFGFLDIEGRLDDVIVRGGENISPGEIEEALREHPAIAEVAVCAIPSQEWGEVIARPSSWSARSTADELRERCVSAFARPVCPAHRLPGPTCRTTTPTSCSGECSRPNPSRPHEAE